MCAFVCFPDDISTTITNIIQTRMNSYRPKRSGYHVRYIITKIYTSECVQGKATINEYKRCICSNQQCPRYTAYKANYMADLLVSEVREGHERQAINGKGRTLYQRRVGGFTCFCHLHTTLSLEASRLVSIVIWTSWEKREVRWIECFILVMKTTSSAMAHTSLFEF